MLAKLRGGTAELRIETGRWSGLSRDEQISKNCDESIRLVNQFLCQSNSLTGGKQHS